MQNLDDQLRTNNNKYWEVRKRVKKTQQEARDRDALNLGRKNCRIETNRLISTGFLIKKPCEVCGLKEVDAHHLNYNDPIDVLFLCKKHHREWHKIHGEVPGGEYFLQ